MNREQLNYRQLRYLAGLELLTDINIRERHRLVCGKRDARHSIAGLRKMRKMIADGYMT